MAPNNNPSARIVRKDRSHWQGKHENYTEPIERLYDLWNPEGAASLDGIKATVAGIQSLMQEAIDEGARLRAFGGNWSISTVAVANGRLVNTKPLNWVFTLSDGSLSADYAGDRTSLLFAQCGISIAELHAYLAARQRSLKTSGASNGQTIAGAMSTGTHGSAIDVGAVQDYVVGLHLVVGPSRHVWLERASYPVVADAFAARLGADLIRDDTLFNAALVNLGSFGFIHGVLIETEPIFLLEAHRQRMPYDDRLRRAIGTHDFSELTLPHPGERPFHFEVVVNPYDITAGAHVTVMYKRPYRSDYPRPEANQHGFRPGDDILGIIGTISDIDPAVTPLLVNGLLGRFYDDYAGKMGTLGEIFTNTVVRGRSTGSAMAVPLAVAPQALEAALEVHEADGPFLGVVALRFVPRSRALMAFTRFERNCIVDLDGIHSQRTLRLFERVWEAFAAASIPFTMHWGKTNDYLTPARVRAMYGEAVDQWIESRHTLLSEPVRNVFTNAFLERCGLAGSPAAQPGVPPLVT